MLELLRKADPEHKYLERALSDTSRSGSIKRSEGDKRPKDYKWDPSKSPSKPQNSPKGDTWSGGPGTQFQNTTVLVECGMDASKKESLTTGAIRIKAVSEYYKGERPPFPSQ